MFKWWKRNKSKNIPMSTSNDDNKKKKTRSLVSFFIDNDNSHRPNSSVDIDLRDPTLIYHPEQSTRRPNFKPPTHYLELLDELINNNPSCFGFSLSQISSKYCLYITIIIFLVICLIISLIAILKK
jgi:hypothetical protein